MAFELPRIDPANWHSFELLQLVIDTIPDPVFVKDLEHRWIACNDGFGGLVGRTRVELIGKSDPDFFPPEQVKVFWQYDDELFRSGKPNDNEENITDVAGMTRT